MLIVNYLSHLNIRRTHAIAGQNMTGGEIDDGRSRPPKIPILNHTRIFCCSPSPPKFTMNAVIQTMLLPLQNNNSAINCIMLELFFERNHKTTKNG